MLFSIVNHDSVFQESFDVKDCEFNFSGWRDDIGSYVVKKVKDIPGDFNIKQKAVWDKIAKVKDVKVDEIVYDSKRVQIDWLRQSE